MGDLMVPFQAGLPIPTYELQSRPRMELTDGWHMMRMNLDSELSLSARTPETIAALEKEGKGAHLADFEDSRWLIAMVPGVSNPAPRVSANGVWYRRRITVPPAWRGKRLLLHCLGANYVADLWVNGRHVGYHEGGFTPFSFDITSFLNEDAPDVIAVRVDNPPWRLPLSDLQQSLLPPGPGDWWNGTGLVRDFFLEAVPAVSVVRADVRAEPLEHGVKLKTAVVLRNAGSATVAGRMELRIFPTRVAEANLTSPSAEAIMMTHQPVEVTEGSGNAEISIAANAVNAWAQTLTTEDLSEWSPAHPNLYVLEVTLRAEDGRVADRLTTQFGVRAFTVDQGKPRLLLNGQPIVLVGLNRIEDDPQLGRTRSYRDALRTLLDLRVAKNMGANFLRLGHGVAHPLTTLLTDRMGLLCWEEIPAAWLSAEAMQLQWERRRLARQTFIEMVYQDFNRPSVGFWGVGHALAPGAVHRDFTRDLADIGRFLDGTRVIGESSVLDEHSPEQTEADVLGYALSPSVGANEGALGDAISVLDRRHRAQPAKPVIVIEFGARAGSDASAWDRQVALAEDVGRILSARPWVAGCAWWTLADCQAPEGVRETGVVSRDRHTTRPVERVLQTQFGAFAARDRDGAAETDQE